MPKKHPPCMRGLRRFEKTGCPEKEWDGEEGCQAWIEETVTIVGEPGKKHIVKKCLDLWMYTLAWHNNRLSEGNQQAIESFRNNMTTKAGPKPDPALIKLLQIISSIVQQKQIISNHELQKQLDDENNPKITLIDP